MSDGMRADLPGRHTRSQKQKGVNMALIELNLEKPALKRTELIGTTDGEETTSSRSSDIDVVEDEPMEDADAEAEGETQATSIRSRGRRAARRAAMLGAVAGGAMAARKLRARRKAKAGDQTEVDEDWQTASAE